MRNISARPATLALIIVMVIGCAGFKDCGGKNNAQGNTNAGANSNTAANSNTGEVLSTKKIDEMAGASRELAHDVGLGIDAVALLYQSKKIGRDLKDQIAEQLRKLSSAGRTFNALVVRLSDQQKAGKLPANWMELLSSEWGTLFALYGDLTTSVSALDPGARADLQTGTSKLDTAISTIRSVIGLIQAVRQ
jgi:hypothetical protein